ncbi:MAG: hypothetical protein WD060_04895 [Pirellulales bacterium]
MKWLVVMLGLMPVAADGHVEWRLPVGSIHDLHLLPNGHLLDLNGWTRIIEVDADRKPIWRYDAKQNGNESRPVEVTPDKRVVWTFKDFTTFGNSMPVAVVQSP